MRVFITASYGKDSDKYINILKNIVSKSWHTPFCFATDYPLIKDPKELMQLAEKEILASDILLYDATNPGTGRLIEVGIAYACNKKVIVIAKQGTEIKDTLKGVADILVFYRDLENLTILF